MRTNYKILNTDYENFSIVYNCELYDDLPKEWFYVLARSKTLSESVKEQVENLVDEFFDRKSSVFRTEEK